MKYGDKIIVKKENLFGETFFTTGTFIIDRPDLKVVLIELSIDKVNQFEEVNYKDINNTIIPFAIYANIFLKKYLQILKDTCYLNKIKDTISKKINPEIFNRHVNNMIICKQQIDLWNKFLAAGRMTGIAKEVIKTNTKGYRRNSKIIHFIYNDYPTIKLKDLANLDYKIRILKDNAKKLLNEFQKINQYINE